MGKIPIRPGLERGQSIWPEPVAVRALRDPSGPGRCACQGRIWENLLRSPAGGNPRDSFCCGAILVISGLRGGGPKKRSTSNTTPAKKQTDTEAGDKKRVQASEVMENENLMSVSQQRCMVLCILVLPHDCIQHAARRGKKHALLCEISLCDGFCFCSDYSGAFKRTRRKGDKFSLMKDPKLKV
jgi:hypothetical protein